MNKAKKAVLFNALLFPGWGQIYLKQYKKGIVIISSITAGTIFVLWSIIQEARNILKIAPFKKGSVTFDAVIQLAVNSIKSLNCFHFSLILFFMLLLWIFSMVDSYLSGKTL